METNELSPIVVIKQKELELAERLAAAKQAAERAILDARQWATDYRDQAEREGQERASAFYRAELEACDAEAEKTRADGELLARWIAERGSRSLDQAVQCIQEIVLPSLPQPQSALASFADSGSYVQDESSQVPDPRGLGAPSDPTAIHAASAEGPRGSKSESPETRRKRRSGRDTGGEEVSDPCS